MLFVAHASAASAGRQRDQSVHQCVAPIRKVLVTGATGFIGSHLVPALIQSGYEPHLVTRHQRAPSASVIYHHADITDQSAIETLLSTHVFYAVLHLAALISYTRRDESQLHETNVRGTQILSNAVHSKSPQTRFIHCSSVAAVGSNVSAHAPPLTEHTPWDARLNVVPYLRTKHLAEQHVRHLAQHGLRAAILCPSNAYGAGDARKKSRQTQVKAANGRWPIYTNGGVNVVHVRVVVEAFLALLNCESDVWDGRRFLVVGENVTIAHMLKLCAQLGGNARHAPKVRLPDWLLWTICVVAEMLGSTSFTRDRYEVARRFHWYDGSAARQTLALSNVSAREAIADSVTWMREQGLIEHRR